MSTTATATGKVKFAGVYIAGFDFGMVTSGTQDLTQVVDESVDGVTQIRHFVNDDTFNIFRLPAGWQYLVNNNLGGQLDATNFGEYDKLVQGCLSAFITMPAGMEPSLARVGRLMHNLWICGLNLRPNIRHKAT